MLGDYSAPIRRTVISFVVLSLLSPAGLGVAAASVEDTGVAATVETTEEAVTYVRSVEEMRGHLLMSLVAVRDGDREGAVYQAEETLSEQWPIVGQQLRAANATLADELEASLETAVTMAEEGSTEAYTGHLQNEVFPLLQQAETAAVKESRLRNSTFNAAVVAGLLERANAEYTEGVTAEGTVEEQSDYRSAQAYSARAGTVYENEIRDSVSEHAAEELDELFELLSGAVAGTEAPEEIERLVGSITHELAEYTGIEAGSSGGVETIERIESDLQEAVEAYDAGNPDEAKSIIKSTYLSNFEGIEGTLIENDPELVEELEADFNEELPGLIDEGAQTSAVREKVESMEQKLETAEGILAEQSEEEINLTKKNETTAPTTGSNEGGDTEGTTETSTPGFGVILAALALGLVAAARYRA